MQTKIISASPRPPSFYHVPFVAHDSPRQCILCCLCVPSSMASSSLCMLSLPCASPWTRISLTVHLISCFSSHYLLLISLKANPAFMPEDALSFFGCTDRGSCLIVGWMVAVLALMSSKVLVSFVTRIKQFFWCQEESFLILPQTLLVGSFPLQCFSFWICVISFWESLSLPLLLLAHDCRLPDLSSPVLLLSRASPFQNFSRCLVGVLLVEWWQFLTSSSFVGFNWFHLWLLRLCS